MREIQICQQEEPTSQRPSEVLLKVCSGGLWETCSKQQEYHPGLLVTEDLRMVKLTLRRFKKRRRWGILYNDSSMAFEMTVISSL